MRRTLAITLLGLLALAAPAGAATPVAGSTPSPTDAPPLSAKLTACATGSDPLQRVATFTGSMPARGARRMAMRFVLQQRLDGARSFATITVPGWGGWETSDPGRPGFIFTKRIDALVGPGAYRARVTFHWLDRRGHVVRSLTRTTARCVQPDPRPDLAAGRLDGVVRPDGSALYSFVVRNDGVGDAGAFTVALTVGGTTLAPVSLAPLAAGDHESGTVAGPRCAAGSTVTVAVDAGNTVDESDEADDVVQRPCPLG